MLISSLYRQPGRSRRESTSGLWLHIVTLSASGFDANLPGERLRGRGALIDIGETLYLNNATHSLRLGFAFVFIKKSKKGIEIIAEEVNNVIEAVTAG